MNKIPVGQTIVYAYAFTFGHLAAIVRLIWAPTVLMSAASYVLAHIQPDTDVTDAATQDLGAVFIRFLAGVAIMILVLGLRAIVSVVLTRQALGLPTTNAPYYFAFGRPEWRMFLASLRFVAAFVALVSIQLVVATIVGVVFGIALGADAGDLAGGLTFFVLAVWVFAELLRMGFCLPATMVAEEKGGLRRSHDLTRGNSWRLVAIGAAILVPLVAIMIGAEYLILRPSLPADFFAGPFTPERVQTMAQQFAAATKQQEVYLLALGFAVAPFASGLIYSASAFAYRALVPGVPDSPRALSN